MKYDGHQPLVNGEPKMPFRDSDTFENDIVKVIRMYAHSRSSVLDVGCGNGRILKVLQKYWVNSTGIEPDEYDFVTDGITQCTMEEYKNKHDVIVMIGFVYLYKEKLDELIENIRSLLNRRGLIVVAGDPRNSTEAFNRLKDEFILLDRIYYTHFQYLILRDI